MFWKKDNNQNKDSSAWSITVRLAILYTVLTATILASTTGFLYWVLKNNVENADRRFLNDKIEVLKSISKQPGPELKRLKDEVQSDVAAYQFNRYYARVLDTEGSVLIETPDMSTILPAGFFPARKETTDQYSSLKRDSKEGDPYLLMSARAPGPWPSDSLRSVQVALNIRSQKQILADYLHTLLIVLVIAILLSAAAGAWVARKGMQPLAKITRTVQRISASKLAERTHPARWPSELTILAGAFDAMLDRLEASFLRLRQFSADLAHELRTPVNNLMGETEVALSKVRSSAEYRKVLESNLEEYNRLSQLIKNLLFLAEADNTDMGILKEAFYAREEVEKVVEFYGLLANEQSIKINLQGQANVFADPNLFRRAASNILSNAIQYAPDHSRIDIHLSQKNDSAHVVIKDEGPGMDQEHISKLFDRFYRVDPSRSFKLGGTGLGLPIVKSIMDLHGGSIDIQSRPGAGTTVTLVFPTNSNN